MKWIVGDHGNVVGIIFFLDINIQGNEFVLREIEGRKS